MKLHQLEAFRQVMLTGSISQAARNLGRTQPAVSAAISGLEADIGFELFERRGRRLHPVPEAHYLLSETVEIIDRLNTAERNMKNLGAMRGGELRVVSMPGPSVFLLPAVMSRFTEGRDDIRIRLITRSSPQVKQLVSTQSYDLGILDVSMDDSETDSLVQIQPFSRDCVCALPARHPLASRALITPADLDGKPMAVLQPDHQTHRDTEAAFRAAGVRFNVQFETQYFIPLLTFVEHGNAVALVDTLSAESYLRYRGEAGSRVVFRRFEPSVQITFATVLPAHRVHSQLTLAFIRAWRAEMEAIGSKWMETAS